MTHTNRLDSPDPRNNYGISATLRQAARHTLYAIEDPATGDLLIGPEKSNLGMKDVAHRFDRTPVQLFAPTPDSDGTVARLDFVGDDGKLIREYLAGQGECEGAASKADKCVQWVGDVIGQWGGSIPSTDLDQLGECEGYSHFQIHRARKTLGVQAKSVDGRWNAVLPA